MKSKLLVILTTLFCLFAFTQVGAQLPPPSGDDGDNDDPIVFYFACVNSDGSVVFTRERLNPAEAAALCDGGDDDGNIGTPFG